MIKIVILDGHAANPGDLNWSPISQFGTLEVFDRTAEELAYERAKEADVLVVNKHLLPQDLLQLLPKLKLICTLATGYNNIDVEEAGKLGITICNAVGYSSPSVAQHVFSLLLEMTNSVSLHNRDVQSGGWANAPDWCYWKSPLMELSGKTMGIYGLGKIGQKVAQVALGFGMRVIANRRNMDQPPPSHIEYVTMEQLFSESDVLTLHAPLTDDNAGIVNTHYLSMMKSTAYLINTGRGGLIRESDLRNALLEGTIAGAGLDVLSQEPPPADHPLIGVPNCLVTPHQAWATRESRSRLIQIVADNIKAFLDGQPQNRVN